MCVCVFLLVKYLLFITRSLIDGDVELFVTVVVVDIIDDVVAGGDDAGDEDVFVDDEEFEILLETVALVAIMIMVYPSG